MGRFGHEALDRQRQPRLLAQSLSRSACDADAPDPQGHGDGCFRDPDPEEALRAYTEHGAYSQGAEGVKGRLDAGMLADIAVFSRDLLTAEPGDILNDTRCEMTILDGRIVHDLFSAN
ncbi:amidohydrolase family protein [Paracoccus cavernae]|uniref:amidohydrolase family protein n=1 Tax=Paracoccus cavernae TaxID=1571207 RepID=UPI0036423298